MSALLERMLRATSGVLDRARTSADVVLAVVMAAIMGALIVPLPEWALDAGIALNLVAGLTLLVAALYARDALQVAAFPTLLLVTTLFRLAMNVSSTRLALSDGHAGHIIQAFGEFVVRGDYVVGAVIFAILTLVQFLVVAKGAERVAEVSARFTLDAMPGKQMSIDADLRAGAITQEQGRARRRELERESQMFGSMDGAMKFIKGDVVAGLVITLINLLGGIAIGTLQNGMTVSEAVGTYALISIGDGLVSQIPSLCIAVAAALVVTRVAGERVDSSLGSEIGSQFLGQYKALFIVAGLSVALAAVPGMPVATFLIIAGTLALVGLALRRTALVPPVSTAGPTSRPGLLTSPRAPAEPSAPRPRLEELPPGVSPLVLDLCAELSFVVEEDGGRFAREDLDRVRERIFLELGVRLPPFRVRVGAPLPAGAWALSVDEVPAGKGQLPVELRHFLSAGPAEVASLQLSGPTVVDPSTGRPCLGLAPPEAERARQASLPVRTTADVIGDHLVALLRRRTAGLLGVQEVQQALAALEATHPALVREALAKVPLPLLTDVLKKLLAEHVSIRNLRGVLEALLSPSTEGDAAQLAERVRAALARQLSFQYAQGGPLYAYLVDPQVEEALRTQGQGLDPQLAGAILEGVKRVARQGKAVLLTSPDIRRLLKRLVEGPLPEVAVLTFGELDPELQIRPVGRVSAAS